MRVRSRGCRRHPRSGRPRWRALARRAARRRAFGPFHFRGSSARILPLRPRGGAVLDHVKIPVKDFDESRKFYEQVLGSIGGKVVMEFPGLVLLGNENGMVAISQSDQVSPMHVAFKADRAGVQKFYDAALAAGAADDGAPGVRSDIHPNYYAAFVHDPNGHNIEAVCHTPE